MDLFADHDRQGKHVTGGVREPLQLRRRPQKVTEGLQCANQFGEAQGDDGGNGTAACNAHGVIIHALVSEAALQHCLQGASHLHQEAPLLRQEMGPGEVVLRGDRRLLAHQLERLEAHAKQPHDAVDSG